MDWSTLLRLFVPLIIKLLQGVLQLPPEAQQQFMQALTAPGPEDQGFSGYTPQPGDQFPVNAPPAQNPSVARANANVGKDT